jgi:hypothetical protein
LAECALRFSRPLLEVDVPYELGHVPSNEHDQRALLTQFVDDVACVVAVRREDLVPRVAERYPQLFPAWTPCAEDTWRSDQPIPQYLDPAGGRTRLEIAKDFVLPVLSVAIALVALVISLAK